MAQKFPIYELLGLFTKIGVLSKFKRLADDNTANEALQSIAIGVMYMFNLPSVEYIDYEEYEQLIDVCISAGLLTAEHKTMLKALADKYNPPITITPPYVSPPPYQSPSISTNDNEAITTLLTTYINNGGNTKIELVVSYLLDQGYKSVDGNSITPILNNILNPPPADITGFESALNTLINDYLNNNEDNSIEAVMTYLNDNLPEGLKRIDTAAILPLLNNILYPPTTTTTSTTTLPPLIEPTAEEIKQLIREYIVAGGNTDIIADIVVYINNNLPAGYNNTVIEEDITTLLNEVLAENLSPA